MAHKSSVHAETVDEYTDLIRSRDDGGWYFHRYPLDRGDWTQEKTSRIYPTREAALAARRADKIEWDE